MHIVNVNDMDALFKEAAANYQLDAVAAADWDKVAASLNETYSAEETVAAKKTGKKRRWFFLWWLLLLPLGWMAHYEWQQMSGNNETLKVNENTPSVNPAKSNPQHENEILKNQNDNAAANNETEAVATGKTLKGKEKNLTSQQSLPAADDNKRIHEQYDNNSAEKKKADKSFSEMLAQIQHENEKANKNPGGQTFQQNVSSSKQPAPGIIASVKKDSAENINAADADKKTLSKTAASSPVKITLAPRTNFYAGLMLGADLSTVKMQHASGVGYSYGFLFGYRFNKRWQIESGFSIDKKNYATKGDYFNKSSTPYLQNVNLLHVDGNCNMIELPINIRYNFSATKSNTWFASAGVSTYLMSKEYYDFHFTYNGNYWVRGYDYHNSGNNWFSVINLGAGYERKLGNAGTIRLEPYMRISAAGVGRGKLSLNSAGVYAGYSIRIP